MVETMKKLFSRFKYVKTDGKIFPSFYYGFGYYDMYSNSYNFFVFPLNIIIRIWRAFRYIQNEKWHYQCFRAKTEYNNSLKSGE